MFTVTFRANGDILQKALQFMDNYRWYGSFVATFEVNNAPIYMSCPIIVL